MNRASWFLVSYDIADPRRLRTVHRLLRGCAHPLLESLFAFQGDVLALRRELAGMLDSHRHGSVAECRIIEVLSAHEECAHEH